jgi:ADP-heptose:LPS heptosyltransferase
MMRFWAKTLDKILVIKLAALGDFIQAIGPFTAIRKHHSDSQITLLTTKPFVELAYASRLFDQIWVDKKPRALAIGNWCALRGQLLSGEFKRVYDLQTSDRSSFYRRLFWPRQNPEWSGIARGCSHPHNNIKRDFMHTVERQAEQLRMAGIENVNVLGSLGSLAAPVDQFALSGDIALLVPGGAKHRPEKRWPVERFSELARQLLADGLSPVLVGGSSEAKILEKISADCPESHNLCGQTSLLQIAALARHARVSVGNDTGPMHLVAAMGCQTVVLYGHSSDPALCGQRGPNVTYIRKPLLKDITVKEVKEVSIT